MKIFGGGNFLSPRWETDSRREETDSALLQNYSFDRLLPIASLSLKPCQVLAHVSKALNMFANGAFSWIGYIREAGFDQSNPAFGSCQPPRKIMNKFGLAGCKARSFIGLFSPALMADVQTVTIGTWVDHNGFVFRDIGCVPHC